MRARTFDGPFDVIDTLRDRLKTNRSLIDLGAYVGRHPWAAVGIAAVAGLAMGLTSRRARPSDSKSSALFATVGLIAWRLAKSVALDYAGTRAKDWIGANMRTDAARDSVVH